MIVEYYAVSTRSLLRFRKMPEQHSLSTALLAGLIHEAPKEAILHKPKPKPCNESISEL